MGGGRKKSKGSFETRVVGRLGRGRPRVTWKDRKKRRRTIAEMKKINEDGSSWRSEYKATPMLEKAK